MLAAAQKRIVIIRGFIGSPDGAGARNFAAIARASARFSDLKKYFCAARELLQKSVKLHNRPASGAALCRVLVAGHERQAGENQGIDRRIGAIWPLRQSRRGARSSARYNKLTSDSPQSVRGKSAATAPDHGRDNRRRRSSGGGARIDGLEQPQILIRGVALEIGGPCSLPPCRCAIGRVQKLDNPLS
ncbi:hypothetical protein ACVIGA_007248 [Bradyrhizobium sp. USDA 3240]